MALKKIKRKLKPQYKKKSYDVFSKPMFKLKKRLKSKKKKLVRKISPELYKRLCKFTP